MEDNGMEGIADRLGVSSRHLRRLFIQHLGAPPSAVAKTRRLHFAKKLIDETKLSMTDIAFAAGFGCVRRFNAVIRKTYKRTPTHIRRLVQKQMIEREGHYLFHLGFRPPYHWKGMLSFLAAHATPGVEAANLSSYKRSISLNGSLGYFEVSLAQERDALAVRVQIAEPRTLYLIIERIRRMFDLNADWTIIAQSLGTDPSLISRIIAEPGLRVPGCWDAFELTTRTLLGRESSVKAANALAGKLAKSLGQRISGVDKLTHLFPTAAILADARLESLGLTKKQTETIRALACGVCDGQISFEGVGDSEAFIARLRETLGIDESTAQYVVMRTLGEPDALPIGDLGLLRTLGLKTSQELEKRAEAWRPWRSYASMYLWRTAKS